jgi:hypothetical protein
MLKSSRLSHQTSTFQSPLSTPTLSTSKLITPALSTSPLNASTISTPTVSQVLTSVTAPPKHEVKAGIDTTTSSAHVGHTVNEYDIASEEESIRKDPIQEVVSVQDNEQHAESEIFGEKGQKARSITWEQYLMRCKPATEDESPEEPDGRVPTSEREFQDTNTHVPRSPSTGTNETDRKRREKRERRKERKRMEKESKRIGSEPTAGENERIEPPPPRIFHAGAWYVLDQKSLLNSVCGRKLR